MSGLVHGKPWVRVLHRNIRVLDLGNFFCVFCFRGNQREFLLRRWKSIFSFLLNRPKTVVKGHLQNDTGIKQSRRQGLSRTNYHQHMSLIAITHALCLSEQSIIEFSVLNVGHLTRIVPA